MNGRLETIVSGTGFPYAGGEAIQFNPDDVMRLGKLTVWGSSVIQFVVQLRDGRRVFVKAVAQLDADTKWLRKIAKPIRSHACRREEGWALVWGAELCSICCADSAVAGHSGKCSACWTEGAINA